MVTNKSEGLFYNLKVLYVEDEEFHREQMGIFLKRRVGKLYLAENGVSGIQKFNECNPDIVITDLKMPEMDGIELTKQIRKLNKDCAVIITTAFSDVETILEAVNIGIDKYILKPIKNDELIEAMQSAAVKIFKKRPDVTVIGDNIILDKADKVELESEIKNQMARFIKTNTGKGPKDISVFINGDIIEIKAYDTLTLYEKKLIENVENDRIINYSRHAFYLDRKDEIERMLKEILSAEVTLDNVTIDSKDSVDKINVLIK